MKNKKAVKIIKETVSKVMPPKTKAAIIEYLKVDNWRRENGCDVLICPFVASLVRQAEKIETEEKKYG